MEQLPGDADGNEQINLSDFANCYTGSADPGRPHGGAYVSTLSEPQASACANTRRHGTVTTIRDIARAEARGSGVYGDRCCGIMDFDTDGDIDLDDFAEFRALFAESHAEPRP